MREIYEDVTGWGRVDRYEVYEYGKDRVPCGYMVWNIGSNIGADDLVPFVLPEDPNDPNNYGVRTDNMIAVRMPTELVKVLRASASCGGTDPERVEKVLSGPMDKFVAARSVLLESAREIFKNIYDIK